MKNDELGKQDIINDIRKSYAKNGCNHIGKEFSIKCDICKYNRFIKKLTDEQLLNNDYSYVRYIQSEEKVNIRCISCDSIYPQTPHNHLKGQGCPSCKAKKVSLIHRFDLSRFTIDANVIHGISRFDYGLVTYIDAHTDIIIKCNICEYIFSQKPYSHLAGHGCPKCKGNIASINSRKKIEDVLLDFRKVHGDKFTYYLDGYTNNKIEIDMKCNTCRNIFSQRADCHLNGQGCPYCAGKHKTTQVCILEFEEIHRNRFNYDKFIYSGAHTDGTIMCNKCEQEFFQPPSEHLSGNGCPYCRMSKGEISIMNFLDDNIIDYSCQKRYADCRGLGNLPIPFDFFIPKYNLLIEFDGVQHYKLGCNFRGHTMTSEEFAKIKEHDRRKNEYAKINNIDLLRIPYYNIKRIPEILREKLNK